MSRVIAAFVMVALYIGCASVPDVEFVRDAVEGGGGNDGGGNEGGRSDSGPSPETGAPLCGGRELPTNATCCDDVACVGNCTSGPCRKDCGGKCGPEEICCRRGNGDIACVPRNAGPTCL